MPTPEEVRREADDAVREFSKEVSRLNKPFTAKAPPKVEVSEMRLDSRPTNVELNRGDGLARQSTGGFGSFLPPPSGPTGACCVGGLCAITTAFACSGLGGVYMGDGTICSPDPC